MRQRHQPIWHDEQLEIELRILIVYLRDAPARIEALHVSLQQAADDNDVVTGRALLGGLEPDHGPDLGGALHDGYLQVNVSHIAVTTNDLGFVEALDVLAIGV